MHPAGVCTVAGSAPPYIFSQQQWGVPHVSTADHVKRNQRWQKQKYTQGWKAYFRGARFNRLSDTSWRKGFLDARDYASRNNSSGTGAPRRLDPVACEPASG